MNPFDKSFSAQYELARKIGDARFGSECKHEVIYAGRCMNCLRRVLTMRGADSFPNRRDYLKTGSRGKSLKKSR